MNMGCDDTGPYSGHSIPLSVPQLGGSEWTYVKECLDTGWVSSVGHFVTRFEQMFARRVGARHAIATVSGTAALHVALLVAGIKPDDEVLVSSLTFIAPANAIRYAGAWPVFIDADPATWQMDPQRVVEFLKIGCRWKNGSLQNRETGRHVRGILPVHILGHPVDVDPILEAARKFKLVVIEDATESLSAKYRGRAVGCLGDIACFSFNGNKVVTTGGGGMIVTDNPTWAERARYLTTQAKDDPLEFIHRTIGFNYRLSNIQAAVGCAQLERLDDFVSAKRRIAHRYAEACAPLPGVSMMWEAPWAYCTYWLSTLRLDASGCRLTSRALLRALEAEGVQARPLWQPLHLSPAHTGHVSPPCPTSEALNRQCLSLPSSSGLTTSDQELVVDVLQRVL